MAKFNSSRSKLSRNPGPVGRVRKFNQSSSGLGSKSSRGNRNGRGRDYGRNGVSSWNGKSGREEANDGVRRGKDGRRPDFNETSGKHSEFSSRRRDNENKRSFHGKDDYVRMEAPSRRGKNASSDRFNPLSLLRADAEDGILSFPSMKYVDMEDAEYSRLNDFERRNAGARSGKGRNDFRGKDRVKDSSDKFMKDFRDAGSGRKPTVGRKGLKDDFTFRAGKKNDVGNGRKGRDSFGGRGAFGQNSARKKTAGRKVSALEGERLQKVLAVAGFGSRRDCEEFIVAGRVTVDREVVTELGTRVMPNQTIHLDGELVRRPKKFAYYALNKPGNVICSNDDPDGRRRALDFIHENVPGLFAVGRLDLHSEGLLLITNDGELANRLTHPSYEVPKVYRVRVSGTPTRREIAQVCRGVHLAEGLAKADEVYLRHVYRDGTAILEMTLREGRNREIRRILAKIGHNVLELTRISVGDVKLGKLAPGAYRPLTTAEVRSLKKLVGLTELNTARKSVSAENEAAKSDGEAKSAFKVKSGKNAAENLVSESDSEEEKAAKARKLEEKRRRTEEFFERQREARREEGADWTSDVALESETFESEALEEQDAFSSSAEALYEKWKAAVHGEEDTSESRISKRESDSDLEE